jgi:hypothetical protein
MAAQGGLGNEPDGSLFDWSAVVSETADTAAHAAPCPPTRHRARPPSANRVRSRERTPGERAVVIMLVAIVMGSLFVASYSLALGDPVPHHIRAAVVGNLASHARVVNAVDRVAGDSLAFRAYDSVPAALHAVDTQAVYAALDLTSRRPTMYVASAAGASVARLLERISASDPVVNVVDAHPLSPADPNGLDVFYIMLVTSVIGFTTVFQVRANAGGLSLRHFTMFLVAVALAAPLALTLIEGLLLHRLNIATPESWAILALQLVAVASFASLMSVLTGRWAILPTWLFFVILGNASSGGAVAPPLLPPLFAFVSQWLPSGATVSALRDAVYFRGYQHARPIVVLSAWAAVLFTAMLVVSYRRRASPGEP